MNIIFLDDCPNRTRVFKTAIPSAKCVVDAQSAINAIQSTPDIDQLYLDHDLGGETYVDSSLKNTGMEVVRWIVANKPNIRKIVCHSLNEPARRSMAKNLAENGYKVSMVPWIQLASALK